MDAFIDVVSVSLFGMPGGYRVIANYVVFRICVMGADDRFHWCA